MEPDVETLSTPGLGPSAVDVGAIGGRVQEGGGALHRSRIAPIAAYVISIFAALLATFGILWMLGAAPSVVISTISRAAFGSLLGFSLVMNKFTPLVLGAAGIAFAMRAGYVNLGVDGQIYAGASLGVGTAFLLQGFSAAVLIPVVLLAAMLGGGCFALIAAGLRHRWGVNELFTTVMLNFVGFYLADWLTTGPWTDPIAGEAVTKRIPDAALLPRLLGRVHVGFVLGVIIAIGLTWWLYKTRPGFNLRAVGINRRAAQFGGVSPGAVTFVALGVSGVLAGLAGAIEVTGVHGRMPSGLSPNYGYISVLIAVLARRNPAATILTAFGFAILIVGGDSLQFVVNLPASSVLMFQALIVLAVLWVDAKRFRTNSPRALLWRNRP